MSKDIVEECYTKYREATAGLPTMSFIEICNRADTLASCEDGRIEFYHPSVKDYLEPRIPMNVKAGIIKSAIYIEQIVKLDYKKKVLRDLMSIPADKAYPPLLDLKVLPFRVAFDNGGHHSFSNIIHMEYLKYLAEFKIEETQQQIVVVEVLESLLKYGPSMFFLKSYILFDVLKLNYDFSQILNNNDYVTILFDYAHGEEVINLITLILKTEEDEYDYTKMNPFYQDKIKEAIQEIQNDEIADWMAEEAPSYIEDEMDLIGEDDYDEDDLLSAVLDNMLDNLDVKKINNKYIDVLNKYKISNWADDLAEIEISFDYNYLNDILINAINNYSQ